MAFSTTKIADITAKNLLEAGKIAYYSLKCNFCGPDLHIMPNLNSGGYRTFYMVGVKLESVEYHDNMSQVKKRITQHNKDFS